MLAAVIGLICLLTATAAMAAPVLPVGNMTVEQLRTELLLSGPLAGSMKTVMQGKEIVTLSLNVLAVTGSPDDILDPSSCLILFESSDPAITTIGGIAQGMSGSPIYVDVDTDSDGMTEAYLVGAVSYGDSFTTGGTGLATPIEAMAQIENDWTAENELPLSAPVMTSSGIKDRVIITDEPESFSEDAESGALVVSPMSSLYVGRANSRSALYRKFAGRLQQNGFDIIPLSAPLSSSSERFSTPFEPGSAITALISRGDMWVGGIGTVTYVTTPTVGDTRVVAFGHPLAGVGPCDFYMSNAWIDGIWPNTAIPYKLGTPGALRGTLVEDRPAGVMGVINGGPDDSLVTARAVRTDKGGKVATSTVGLPDSVINSGELWYGIAPYASSIAAWKLFSEMPGGGSAVTTTTVRVMADGIESEIARTNIWDSPYNIADYTGYDADTILSNLQSVYDSGLHEVDILSVNVESSLTSKRNTASIVDIEVPGGLHSGENTVVVSVLERGNATTVPVEATINIPAVTNLNGRLVAMAPGADYEEGEEDYEEDYEYWGIEDRRSVAQVIADIDGLPSNNQLQLVFVPNSDDELAAQTTVPSNALKPVFGDECNTEWFLTGMANKMTDTVEVDTYPSISAYNGWAIIEGMVTTANTGTVEVYLQYSGETSKTLVATTTLGYDPEIEANYFWTELEGLTKNATITVVVPGTNDTLITQKQVRLKVAASMSMTSSSYSIRRGSQVTLTSVVNPGTVASSVVFKAYYGGAWRTIGTKSIVNGKATMLYKPSTTMKIYATTSGAPTNSTGKSRTITISVR